jgi:hypothetical protein
MRPFTAIVTLFCSGLLAAGVALVSRASHGRPHDIVAEDESAAAGAVSPGRLAPPRFVTVGERPPANDNEGGVEPPRFVSNAPPPEGPPEPPPIPAAEVETLRHARTQALAERLSLDPQRTAALHEVLSSSWQRSAQVRRRIADGDEHGTAELVALRQAADRELEAVLGADGARKLRALERQGNDPRTQRNPRYTH